MLNCQSGLFRKKSGSINFRDFSRDLLSLFCKAMNLLTTKNSWRKKKKNFQFPVLSCQQLSNTFVHYQNKKSRLIKKKVVKCQVPFNSLWTVLCTGTQVPQIPISLFTKYFLPVIIIETTNMKYLSWILFYKK